MELIALLGGLAALLWFISQGSNDVLDMTGGDDSTVGADWTPSSIGSAASEAMANKTNANVEKWAQLIQQQEGNTPGSRSNRNNNPGNIRGLVGGAVGTDADGFAVFPTAEAGMSALVGDLNAKVRKYPDYSLFQIMTRYLGGNAAQPPADGKVYADGKYQGNSLTRANQLADAFGASVNTKLSQLFG